MSTSRSQTPSPRISPLPRLESYASYSSTPDRLWDGHDPVRLAAREASIRARMVARARARASEGNSGVSWSEAESEVLVDKYGRQQEKSPPTGPITPNLPTTPTQKSPLKPLILASSATFSRKDETTPSFHSTPRRVSTSGSRAVTRRPSAVELKYSPIASPHTAPQTPASVSFVEHQLRDRKERKSTSPRISISPANRTSDTWSYRSSDYLSPSPTSFGIPPRMSRSPVSPNLLSPSYASSSSPISAFFRLPDPRNDAIPPAGPDVWDDEEQWKRVSAYLVDPYRPSPDISPARSVRGMGNVVEGEMNADTGTRVLQVEDMRLALGSPRHRSNRGESKSPLPGAPQSHSPGTMKSSRLWEALPPLPVEPPSKAVLLERSKSKGERTTTPGMTALGLTEVGLHRREVRLRYSTSASLANASPVLDPSTSCNTRGIRLSTSKPQC